ncbi:helix-turn-helix transcriptional regulator [Chitinophaga barathri]|uniref:Transcriptional regulator n=1 Tax=Chitinophaga barathri TaxID=1647451 RepID=A0A3N4MGK2_9BACT|nr:metalloregulator ArsR/SmtB family transcription factor [Chitinophaga barathri]RPD42981.1 transcriptional regulator [Chitinophaga barathri]
MKNNIAETDKTVWFLKTKGPQPLALIAEALKITTEGARFQLLKLSNEGLVNAITESKGRGRPQQIWSLTSAGHARFSDKHADLTLKIIEKIRETLGEQALDAVIEANTKEGIEKYSKEMEGATDLESKVACLARIRDNEGYMAEYEKEGDGFLLIENHCPICAAATACQNFCRSELLTFQTVLGQGVYIQRLDHIVYGARRCAYRISEKPF